MHYSDAKLLNLMCQAHVANTRKKATSVLREHKKLSDTSKAKNPNKS